MEYKMISQMGRVASESPGTHRMRCLARVGA